MNKYVRDHLLIPIGIPVAVLVGMGFVIVNLSRVLLTLSKTGSVIVGIGVAVAVLFGCAYAASPRHRRRSKVGITLLVIFGLGIGVAGAWAADRGERHIEKHRPSAPAEPSPGASPIKQADVTVDLVAKDTKFDKKTLEFPSGKSIDVHMRNDDATIHNFAMFADAAMTQVVFRGDTFTGPNATKDYVFDAPAPGTYHFHCDVHPTMQGEVTVT
jgi:plastocyanin